MAVASTKAPQAKEQPAAFAIKAVASRQTILGLMNPRQHTGQYQAPRREHDRRGLKCRENRKIAPPNHRGGESREYALMRLDLNERARKRVLKDKRKDRGDAVKRPRGVYRWQSEPTDVVVQETDRSLPKGKVDRG